MVIVDCDLERPACHLVFKLEPGPGLMDYLLERASLGEVIQLSLLDNLDLVTAGLTKRRVHSPFDLDRFAEFLAELKEYYDYILIDSAPALRSTQARIIAQKVDGVILVAAANQTRWEVVNELKRLLEDDSRVLGAVLNKRRFVIPKALYRFI